MVLGAPLPVREEIPVQAAAAPSLATPPRVLVLAATVASLPVYAIRLLGRAVLKAASEASRREVIVTVSASGTTYELKVLQAPAGHRESLQSLFHELEMMDALETDLQFVKQQQLTPFAQYTPYFNVQEAKRTKEFAEHDALLREALKVFCA